MPDQNLPESFRFCKVDLLLKTPADDHTPRYRSASKHGMEFELQRWRDGLWYAYAHYIHAGCVAETIGCGSPSSALLSLRGALGNLAINLNKLGIKHELRKPKNNGSAADTSGTDQHTRGAAGTRRTAVRRARA